jgi:hypothetical protein
MDESLLIAWLVVITVFGAFTAWIAAQKGRSPMEGLILGALFGPLGSIVEACLPQLGEPRRPGERVPVRARKPTTAEVMRAEREARRASRVGPTPDEVDRRMRASAEEALRRVRGE